MGRSGKSVCVLLSDMTGGGLDCSKLVRRLEGAFGAEVKTELCVLVRQLGGRLTSDRGRSPDVRAAKTACIGLVGEGLKLNCSHDARS